MTVENLSTCNSGFYCPEGSTKADEESCAPGYFCPEKSAVQLPCQPGYFNVLSEQDSCKNCTAGFYCSDTSTVNPETCPTGAYCPENSIQPVLCEIGTFNPNNTMSDPSDCELCTSGFYCGEVGADNVTDVCLAGSFCRAGSKTEVGGITSTIEEFNCCAGFECPSGSPRPEKCSPGSYSPTSKVSQCLSCPMGYYCDALQASECYEFTDSSTIKPIDCPTGEYCIQGSSIGEKCLSGTYQPQLNAVNITACLDCKEGLACTEDGLDQPDFPCEPGFYCPSGSNNVEMNQCQPGYFCPQQSAAATPCTPGYYCDGVEKPEPTSQCDAGSYCPSPCDNSGPQGCTSLTQIDCPPGAYCPIGSATPSLCPPGTFTENISTKESSDSTCLPCEPGFFCSSSGMTRNDLENCPPGYYCEEGAISPFLNICPQGNFCPENSGEPANCTDGSFTRNAGAEVCLTCVNGYECSGTVIQLCSEGKYCESGNVDDCPEKTYIQLDNLFRF